MHTLTCQSHGRSRHGLPEPAPETWRRFITRYGIAVAAILHLNGHTRARALGPDLSDCMWTLRLLKQHLPNSCCKAQAADLGSIAHVREGRIPGRHDVYNYDGRSGEGGPKPLAKIVRMWQLRGGVRVGVQVWRGMGRLVTQGWTLPGPRQLMSWHILAA